MTHSTAVHAAWSFYASLASLILAGALIVLPRLGLRLAQGMVALGLLAQAGTTVALWVIADQWIMKAEGGPRAWIWSKADSASVQIGTAVDSLGLGVCLLGFLLVGIYLLGLPSLKGPEKEVRARVFSYASALLGSAGLNLCWSALTPWSALLGMGLIWLGYYFSRVSLWTNPSDADLTGRYGIEQVGATLIAVLGLTALSSRGLGLAWTSPQSWSQDGGATLGAVLFCLGIILWMRPFPFLGWPGAHHSESRESRVGHLLFAQLLPSLSALSMLVRFEPEFRATGILAGIGIFSLSSSILAALAGLLQADSSKSLSLWVSGAFSLAVAATCFAGPPAGIALGLGAVIVAFALSLNEQASIYARESAPIKRGQGGARETWSKLLIWLSVAAGSGVLGFLSFSGAASWIEATADQAPLLASGLVALFLSAILIWKVGYVLVRELVVSTESWFRVLSPLTVLFALALLWTGSLSGVHQLWPGDQLFEPLLGNQNSGNTWIWAASLHGLVLVALLFGYWISGRESGDVMVRLSERSPGLAAFVRDGFGVDRSLKWVGHGLRWVGAGLGRFTDQKPVDEKAMSLGFKWMQVGARGFVQFDRGTVLLLERLVERTFSIPGKLLQIIHGGDVQWYLIFAIGAGAAMLLHFWKIG